MWEGQEPFLVPQHGKEGAGGGWWRAELIDGLWQKQSAKHEKFQGNMGLVSHFYLQYSDWNLVGALFFKRKGTQMQMICGYLRWGTRGTCRWWSSMCTCCTQSCGSRWRMRWAHVGTHSPTFPWFMIFLFIFIILSYININIVYKYELQPKFRLMKSSIRDIFIFWKLSWGLENDNTLFKKR